MTATTAKYVRVLWELKAPVEDLETAVQIYRESPELQRVLTDPSVYKEEKHAVVDRIFPGKKLQNFMKILCDYSDVEYLNEIVEEYKMYANEHQSIVNATLRYVTAPADNQLEANGREWDWSISGRIRGMQEQLGMIQNQAEL